MNNKIGLYTIAGKEDVYMETFTGKYVTPLKLDYEDIDIIDIAHHLSLICRFNGACKEFYSVAQHSVLVANLVSRNDMLAALLHDASEAYMADVIRPIKYSIPELQKIESRIEVRILAKFGCSGAGWEAIKRADNIALATEGRDLMKRVDGWYLPEPPQEEVVEPWTASMAEMIFLATFYNLEEEKNGGKRWQNGRLKLGSER